MKLRRVQVRAQWMAGQNADVSHFRRSFPPPARFEVRAEFKTEPMWRDASDGAAFALAFIGLREGEILGLAWQEVDLEGASAMVLYELRGSGDKATRHQLKTKASEATVPLPPFVVERLRAHRDNLGTERPDIWIDDGLVFVLREATRSMALG